MAEVIQFALLGLGLGALYSLAAQGLMIIYRGSGVLNFAHGAVGMVAAYLCWDTSVRGGLPWGLAFLLGVLVSAAVGALTHLLVMRPLRRSSSLSRIAATLGILIILQGIVVLRWGTELKIVESALPTTRIELFDGVGVTVDRAILLVFAAVVAAALWYVYKHTRFGLQTSAVAENETVTASLGLSPERIATVNWAVGCALAGAAAILISPIVQLQPATMTNLVIAALAPALIASFRSFPVAFLAALAVGVVQTEVTRFVDVPGLGQAVPFLIIVVVLVAKGQSLPARDFFLQRLPQLGDGRIPYVAVIVTAAVFGILVTRFSPVWQDTFIIFFGMATVILSVIVLTGYTGQISLAQYTVGGLGALVVARLDAGLGWPFLLTLAIGVAVIAPLGALLALPAVRARGLNLAVATMGIGAAIELVLFNNPSISGGAGGVDVTPPSFFGIELDPILNTGAYAVFVVVVFTLVALAVANIRRGRSGRRMIAVRTNERAAASLGIGVRGVKVYAFAMAAAIATIGGVILAYRNDVVMFSEFNNLTSINLVAWAMVGGVGYILGSLWGAQLAPSSIGTEIINTFWPHLHEIIAPIGGLLLLLFLLQGEGGLAVANAHLGKKIAGLFGWRPRARHVDVEEVLGDADASQVRVPDTEFAIEDVTVKYGAVVAVDGLSLSVRSGHVTGLIGPNGAGKTTAIDAITGFVRPTSGKVLLDGEDITELGPAARTRIGIARTFQSLELFEDMTVLDNIRTAADAHRLRDLVKDVVWPVDDALPPAARAAVRLLGLEGDLDTKVADMSLGRRRLVAIARAVASQPRFLLLDEPAAGLGDRESLELARNVRALADRMNLAILLVEHDMNFVMSVCDEIAVLDFGKRICYGTPEVVRNDEATIRAYLGGEDEFITVTREELTGIGQE